MCINKEPLSPLFFRSTRKTAKLLYLCFEFCISFELLNYVQSNYVVPLVQTVKQDTLPLSKRPSYTACLNTLKGVYQNRAFCSYFFRSTRKTNKINCGWTELRVIYVFSTGIILPNLAWPKHWQWCHIEYPMVETWQQNLVYGHTMLKTPVLVRSLKLSNIGPR